MPKWVLPFTIPIFIYTYIMVCIGPDTWWIVYLILACGSGVLIIFDVLDRLNKNG